MSIVAFQACWQREGQDFITYAQRIFSVALDMTADITTPLDVAGEYDIHALPSP